MILTITLIITCLIIINFLLLFFSSNKTKKQTESSKPFIIRPYRVSSIKYSTTNLASTVY